MINKILIFVFVILQFAFSGIEIDFEPFHNVQIGHQVPIEGTVKITHSISFNVAILKTGIDHTNTFYINFGSFEPKDSINLDSDLGLTLMPKSSCTAGQYFLKLSVTVDSVITATKEQPFAVIGGNEIKPSQFKGNKSPVISIKYYDMHGRVIHETNNFKPLKLPKGMYIAEFKTKNSMTRKTFIVKEE